LGIDKDPSIDPFSSFHQLRQVSHLLKPHLMLNRSIATRKDLFTLIGEHHLLKILGES
jgi:hypothetical protein